MSAIAIPKGYRFAGVHCDVKPNTTKLDLALVVSDFPSTGAGVYTQNLVCGAPVTVDRSRTPGRGFRAVVVNSGVANACTGTEGIENAVQMTTLVAQCLGAPADSALVLSTGVIGVQLPMGNITRGIKDAAGCLAATQQAFLNAATAMMTTDTHPKMASRQITCRDGAVVTLTGMCKGAAMIGPNMATMLVILMTDAMLDPEVAQKALKKAADATFNCISVEGHTSTSDSVVFLANGAACSESLAGEDHDAFTAALGDLCEELARMIPNDGEGISHLITIDVSGCSTPADAKQIAKTIANDPLVKTAICGADPNWGRIVSAAGWSGVHFDPMSVSLKVNGFLLYKDGVPLAFNKQQVSDHIRQNRETHFELVLKEGGATARFWTSDLTMEYVRLNSDYTT